MEKVTPAGQLSIIAGTGTPGTPTQGPATSSDLSNPWGVAVDASGNLYIADTSNQVVEKVTSPSTSPGPPTNVVATPGNGALSVTWSAPSSDGGSALTDYVVEYSSNGGTSWTLATCSGTATTCTITGLTNATSYVVRVSTTNAVGTGDPSAISAAVTMTSSKTSATTASSSKVTKLAATGSDEAALVLSSGGLVPSGGVVLPVKRRRRALNK